MKRDEPMKRSDSSRVGRMRVKSRPVGRRDALDDSKKYRIGGLANLALLILHIWLGRHSMR
jgi:hypothetical protein